MNTKISARIRTEIRDAATGATVKRNPWQRNLIMDAALTLLAIGGTGYAGIFPTCKVGSGSTANSVNSGATTFTQTTTTITASTTNWFTTNNISAGMLFKYGTGSGGAEYYIVSVSGTTCVVDTSATVGTPTVATVWRVNQTALETYSYKSATYDTGGTNCQTAYSGNVATMQRVYVFPVQGSPYNVQEIGYSNNNNNDGTINGRVVLGSPDTINPTQFYVVTISIAFTQSPGAPTAVLDVGTGINTAGNAMCQAWSVTAVQSNGTSGDSFGSGKFFDNEAGAVAFYIANDISLNGSIAQSIATEHTGLTFVQQLSAFSNSTLPPGVATSLTSFSFSASAQTLYSLVFGFSSNNLNQIRESFVLLLTTPATLSTGVFAGTISFTRTMSRTLTN